MKPPRKLLSEQIVVITGASSGIGLTTAEMAAQAGARVILSSRNEGELLEAVTRIRGNGGRAYHVVADVADPDAVDRIADVAIQQFGGIDTWVNNAGIGMYGKLTDTPLADKRRLFDVDFWGVVHGCRTAVRNMRSGGGTIINIGSVASDRAAPLLGIYSAAKHAVKGYTDALRMELEKDGIPISVSLVKPASINTPFIEHARSHMEQEPEFIPPVYPPEEVARAILSCAERPLRDVLVGGSAKFLSSMGQMAPGTMDAYLEATAFAQQKRGTVNDGIDSFDGPQRDGQRRVPTTRHTMNRSAYTRFVTSRAGRALPFLAASALAAGLAFGLPPFVFTRRERREDGGATPDADVRGHEHSAD
ncbi:MAG TPA: SDR family oxidoreductase [Vicinamibacterales bacterium]|nr:SDR family oxidoreductase [Vicinamibacterales bacterium]